MEIDWYLTKLRRIKYGANCFGPPCIEVRRGPKALDYKVPNGVRYHGMSLAAALRITTLI